MKFIQIPQTDQEIRDNAVMEIITQEDITSLYFGPMNIYDRCLTCEQYAKECPGHHGYIDIPIGFFHPLLQPTAIKILSQTCINCLRINQDLTATKNICEYCSKDFETFELEYIEKKVISAVKCKQYQAYHIYDMLNKLRMKTTNSNEMVSLSPYLLKQIFHNYIINEEYRKINCQVKCFDIFILNTIPVTSAQLRVSQPELKIICMTNYILQKLLKLKIELVKIDHKDKIYMQYSPNLAHYLKQFYVLVYMLLSHHDDISLQQFVGFQKFDQPPSLLKASTGKEGYFRASINGVRVNGSARTVALCDPKIPSWKLGCPLEIAKIITTPIYVNDVNLKYCQQLVDMYPNYPCAKRYKSKTGPVQKINAKNKDIVLLQLQPGDIIFRQVINNDPCMTNRYPSIREESFGCHLTTVRDIKGIQFNLQIIGKLGCDFDGDEVQLFYVASQWNMIEIAMLSGMNRQLITYENGKSLLGGADAKWDIPPGIYHLKNQKQFALVDFNINIIQNTQSNLTQRGTSIKWDNKGQRIVPKEIDNKIVTGTELIELYIPVQSNPNFSKNGIVNYKDDDGIEIVDGKLKSLAPQLCSAGSQFVAFVQYHYGTSYAVQMMDNIMQILYRANEIFGSTIYPTLCINKNSDFYKDTIQKYNELRLKAANKALNDFYTGKIHPPTGVSESEFFEQYYNGVVSNYQLIQYVGLKGYLKVKDGGYWNDIVDRDKENFRDGCTQLGLKRSEKGVRLQPASNTTRMLPCYFSFDTTAESMGFVKGCYLEGLSQTEMFYDCITSRWDIYTKGNSVKDDGYTTRRVSKALDNVRATYNGRLISDNNVCISMQYGTGGYDPRCFIKVPFKFHTMDKDEFSKMFSKSPRYNEMLQIVEELQQDEMRMKRCDRKFKGMSQLVVPYIFKDQEVSEEDLDKLWTCRITSKMSPNMVQIIHNQVMQFYLYCLFYLKIVPGKKSDGTFIKQYLQSLVNDGEPVGPKAAQASTQPLTQSSLSAIHRKAGQLQFVAEDETTGAKRLMELLMNSPGPISFQTQLIGGAKFDEKANEEFMAKYQTVKFSNLKPKISTYYTTSLMMDIQIDIDRLAYYDIQLDMFLTQLSNDFEIQKYDITIVEEKSIIITCMFDQQTQLNQVYAYEIQMYETYQFGSTYIYNLYYTIKNDQYIIVGNILPDSFSKLLRIPGIDQDYTYCNSPVEYQNIFGVERSYSVMYNQLAMNLSTLDVTKNVQKTHVQLMTDQLYYTGKYRELTRQSYKQQHDRDITQLLVYEEPQAFIVKQMLKPTWNECSTCLLSQVMGTRADVGTQMFQVYMQPNIVFKEDEKVKDEKVKDER